MLVMARTLSKIYEFKTLIEITILKNYTFQLFT